MFHHKPINPPVSAENEFYYIFQGPILKYFCIIGSQVMISYQTSISSECHVEIFWEITREKAKDRGFLKEQLSNMFLKWSSDFFTVKAVKKNGICYLGRRWAPWHWKCSIRGLHNLLEMLLEGEFLGQIRVRGDQWFMTLTFHGL